MKDEDGKTWIMIKWSDKLHLFFDVPEGVNADTLAKQMRRVGYINVDKERWHKRYPLAEDIIF